MPHPDQPSSEQWQSAVDRASGPVKFVIVGQLVSVDPVGREGLVIWEGRLGEVLVQARVVHVAGDCACGFWHNPETSQLLGRPLAEGP